MLLCSLTTQLFYRGEKGKMLHRNIGVYQATRCHSLEGSWLHCQHFNSDSFLLLQDTSQGQSVNTREWNIKFLSLVILHCGKVALRSLPSQKFARPLRWDSDKELIKFYRDILYLKKVIRHHVIRVNVMTAVVSRPVWHPHHRPPWRHT